MKRILLVAALTFAFPGFAASAPLIGLTLGLPSAKGKKSDEVHSNSTSYSFIFGVNGTGNFSFESGYTQMADIEDKYADNQKLEASISGIYISGRYSRQFSESSFGYAKLGAYRWSASVREVNDSSETLEADNDYSHNVDGYAPMFALGADFLLGEDRDFGVRVEFEHVTDVGGGVRLKSVNRVRDIAEGYEYNRFALGVVMAL